MLNIAIMINKESNECKMMLEKANLQEIGLAITQMKLLEQQLLATFSKMATQVKE